MGWKLLVSGLIGFMTLFFSAPAASARTLDFSIAPKPLREAIREFSRQTGKSVVFEIPDTDRSSPGVQGRLEERKALAILLGSAPFEIRAVRGGYIVRPAPPRPLRAKAAAAPRRAAEAPRDAPPVQIVVTAQKRAERLIDVPMSITAISGSTLRETGIQTALDLQQIAPGLLTPRVGLAFTPAIRGVTTISTSPGDETNVAIYIDDLYVGAPIAGQVEFSNVERIEILKGPQGTLFGRNATGGAIRIITKPPSFTPSVETTADYGVTADGVKLTGFLTGPVADNLAGSLHLNYSNDNGYIDGVAQNAGRRFGIYRNRGAVGKLEYRPHDDLTLLLIGSASSRRDTSLYAWVPHDRKNANASLPGAVVWDPLEYGGSTLPVAEIDSWSLSMNAAWDREDGTVIRSIVGYRSADGYYQTDTDRLNLPLTALQLRQSQRSFSQEMTLATPLDRLFSILAGYYFYSSRAWNPYFRAYKGDAPDGILATEFTNNVLTDSFAPFGELTLRPADQVHLTFGGRYTSEKKSIDFAYRQRLAGLLDASDSRTWRSATFRGVLQIDLGDESNVYLSAGNGFKTGVFNAYSHRLEAVKPEKIMAYEAGFKGNLGSLVATFAAFVYDYRNIQVQSQTQIDGSFLVSLTNAARAKISGFEMTLAGAIDRRLSIDLGVAALPVAKYTSFPTAQVFIPNPQTGGNVLLAPYDATGSRTIASPKWQINARATYTDRLFSGTMRAAIHYHYNDGFFFQPGNLSRQPAYHVVNASLAWTDPSERFTFSITGTNLINSIYSFYTTDSVVGTSDVLARPREFSIGVATKF